MAELLDGSVSTLRFPGLRFLRSLRLAHAGGAIIVGLGVGSVDWPDISRALNLRRT